MSEIGAILLYPKWEETLMSDIDKNATPKPDPGNVESRKLKTALSVARVAFLTTATAAIILLLLNLSPNGGGTSTEGDFVVKLDSGVSNNHFRIGVSPNGEEGEGQQPVEASDGSMVLIGEPLGNAWVTTNKMVRAYYNALVEEKGLDGKLSGSANYIDPKYNLPAAMVYTFYLNNISETEPQTFSIAANLNHERGQAKDATGVDAYEYLRLGLYMGNNGQADDDVRYFANANMKKNGLESDHGDFRECLSDWTWSEYSATDINRERYRIPAYADSYAKPDPIEVCELFTPNIEPGYEGRGLFLLDDLKIAPGASRRITFIAYLEGEDPDCNGEPPTNQRLGFSLHIGL